MLRVCRPIFVTGKSVVLDSEFCGDKGIKNIESKGVYAEDLTKKRCYWLEVVPGEIIDANFQDQDFRDVGIIKTITQENKTFRIFSMKDMDYAMKIMSS